MSCRLLDTGLTRRSTLCGFVALACAACGCQVGRRWFQIDSNSRSPVMGIELRADADEQDGSDSSPSVAAGDGEVVPVEHVEPEPRRGLRDWFRLPGGEERIPLPTTEVGEDDPSSPPTGPRPEFE